MVVGSLPTENRSVELSGGLGMATLTVTTQPIDCGDSSNCEWALRSGTRKAAVGKAGAIVRRTCTSFARGERTGAPKAIPT